MAISIPKLRPWRVRFDFLKYYDPEDEPPYDYEYVLAGFALERVVTVEEANTSHETARLTPEKVRRFAENVFLYQQVAILKLRFENAKADDLHGRRLADRLEVFASAWRSLADSRQRVYDLADMFGVSRTTIWRMEGEAVRAGLLDEAEISRRSQSV